MAPVTSPSTGLSTRAMRAVSPGLLGPIGVMAAVSGAAWAAVTLSGGARWNPELAFGIGGPLVAAVFTWSIVERTQAAAPERVTGVMMGAFFVKLLLFGLYVVLAGAIGLRRTPFAASFAAAFIGLYGLETWYLRQLFAASPTPLGAVES